MDFVYNADTNQKVRRIVLIKKQRYVERNESAFGIYRTNIPRSYCNSMSIYYLYRCRWQVEILAKTLRSGNSLGGINSGKASINLFYITVCLIAAVLKSFYGMKAFKDDLSRMSILKVSCLYTPFVNFFTDIAKGLKRSSIYEREKLLLDTINRNCEHSKPAQKNRKHLKDLPILLRKIVRLVRSTKKAHARSLIMA